ncbi:MAG: hypothetical protein NC095_11545 [Muribaculum sp.]|nr:hypothetical protein [Muribaculum sp.]
MKSTKTIILLSTFLALAGTVCVAEIPKGRIFRSEFSAEEASRMEIWDMLWPDGSPISPDSSKGTLIFYDDTKARNRVNRYKEILSSDSDTLYLFMIHRFNDAPYCTYGWTPGGDTLMLGDSQFIKSYSNKFPNYPIMDFVRNWNIDSISSYWPYVGHEIKWEGISCWPDYVFKIRSYKGRMSIEGVEICFWRRDNATKESVRETLYPLTDEADPEEKFCNVTREIGVVDETIIVDDAP